VRSRLDALASSLEGCSAELVTGSAAARWSMGVGGHGVVLG